MSSFADRVGVGGRTFRTNAHIGRVDVRAVVSELTGRPVGRIVEHGTGRVDAHATVERTLTIPGEAIFGTQAEARRRVYEMLRTSGCTHDEALARMTRKEP